MLRAFRVRFWLQGHSDPTRQKTYQQYAVVRSHRHCYYGNAAIRSLLDAFAKVRKATISFVMSVRLSAHPHGTPWLPLYGYSSNLIFEYFSKKKKKNSSFIKIWQAWRLLYITNNIRVYFWSYFTQFFLQREIFHTKAVEKIKPHILYSITFYSEIVRFMR
jgi:hypothetical protein